MSTPDLQLNDEKQEKLDSFINTVKELSTDGQELLLHLMKNTENIQPFIDDIDSDDQEACQKQVHQIIRIHKAGFEQGGVNKHVINTAALYPALCELMQLNCFISDTSRLLRQDDVMEDERIVTIGYKDQLAEAIERAANKTSELFEVIEKSINCNERIFDYKPNISLFDMPTEVSFYYGSGEIKGVLANTD